MIIYTRRPPRKKKSKTVKPVPRMSVSDKFRKLSKEEEKRIVSRSRTISYVRDGDSSRYQQIPSEEVNCLPKTIRVEYNDCDTWIYTSEAEQRNTFRICKKGKSPDIICRVLDYKIRHHATYLYVRFSNQCNDLAIIIYYDRYARNITPRQIRQVLEKQRAIKEANLSGVDAPRHIEPTNIEGLE